MRPKLAPVFPSAPVHQVRPDMLGWMEAEYFGGTLPIDSHCEGYSQSQPHRDPDDRRKRSSYETEELELAPTSTNKINLDLLAEDSAELASVLAPIRDEHAFAELFCDDGPEQNRRKHRPLSRGMLAHAQDLEAYEVVEPTAPHVLEAADMTLSATALAILTTIWCVCFLVPKKNRRQGRFVVDCRPINKRMARPPAMQLPAIGTFVRTILQADVAAKTDGKSYFYQFELPRRIRRFFKCRLAGRRGRYRDVQLNRLPMGWSWSPAIAQRTSNFLVRDCGLAWLDDFIVCGTHTDFELRKNTFLERLHKYNVEVDDTELNGSNRLLALGLEFDLVAKRFRVDPAWIEKRRPHWLAVLRKVREGCHVAIRELMEVYGALIWTSYVLEEPLWMHAEALAALSDLAKTASQAGFDEKVPFPAYAVADMAAWVEDASSAAWSAPRDRPQEFTEFVFSDASDVAGAFIRVAGKQIVDGDAWLRDETEHIFLAELEALTRGAATSTGEPLCATDNKTLHYVLRRGHSSSYAANVRLRASFQKARPWSCWIPTHIQPGDKYTRGVPLPSLPLPASSDADIQNAKAFIDQHDAEGVPISKRTDGFPGRTLSE